MSLSNLSAKTKHRLKIVVGAAGLLAGTLLYFKYFNTCCECEDKNASNAKPTCCAAEQKSNAKATCCAMNSTSSCCATNKVPDMKSFVHSRYSATARNFETAFSASEQEKLRSIAKVFGYTPDELAEIGAGANMGLSCGNPVSQAKLKKGEIVLDLGCGAGMDLFLAKALIGDSKDGGQLLGVDFSQDMLDKAMENAQKKKERKNMDISNMKFMLSDIDDMKKAVNDDYVDCVISNCVMNLLPNKLKAFKEVHRVLKPNGGRVCLSDIAFKKEFPPKLQGLKNSVTGFVNCVSGAILATEYEAMLYNAGFKNVKLVNKNVDLNVWKQSWETMVGGGGCCSTESSKIKKEKSSSCCGNAGDLSEEQKQKIQKILDGTDLNDYVASYYVFAYK